MADSTRRVLSEEERRQTREWLENWRRAAPVLEAERWRRVAALSEEDAWAESQGLLQAWEPGIDGDAGEGLILQQDVFARCRRPAR